MKNKITLSLCVTLLLSGCTATNKFKGPNYLFDDQQHSTNIPPETLPTSSGYQVTKDCSEAHSVHSPLIWLPIVGPVVDLLLVPSPSELSWSDAWSILPLVGPPITYIKGKQTCMYHNLRFAGISLEDPVSKPLIDEAIATSDQNCYAYRDMLTGGFNELNANQKFISDASTLTQTGAAFASPVAGAVVGGLKQALTSANDAIKTNFFVNYGARQLFENIGTVREVLKSDLTNSAGMSYADLRHFMKAYDKTCFFEQAISDLDLTTKQGQDTAQSSTGSAGNDIRKDLLINNSATPLK